MVSSWTASRRGGPQKDHATIRSLELPALPSPSGEGRGTEGGVNNRSWGLPWWSSGYDSAFQCWGCGSDPRSGSYQDPMAVPPGGKAKTWNRSSTVATSLEALGVGSIPHQGTRSHVPQLKDSSAATRTQPSQINK